MPEEQTIAEIKLRKAKPEDIPLLEAFLRPFIDDHQLLPRTLTELEDWIEHFFIAEYAGAIVGCAALEIYSKKLAEIRSLAVASDMRGMGIGKRLVQACLDLAREEGIFEVMSISSNEEFFRACGFDYTLPDLRKAFFYQTREEF